jgi:hypothetical protein
LMLHAALEKRAESLADAARSAMSMSDKKNLRFVS